MQTFTVPKKINISCLIGAIEGRTWKQKSFYILAGIENHATEMVIIDNTKNKTFKFYAFFEQELNTDIFFSVWKHLRANV